MRSSSRRRLLVGAVAGSVVLAGLGATAPAQAAARPGPAIAPVTDSFTAVTPTRILDTRSGKGLPGGTPAAVGQGQTVTLAVAGQGGIPASGVDAVVMNVTAITPSRSTYVTVFSGDLSTPPLVSSLNAAAGQIVPNLVTVKLGASGDVKLFNAFGTVNLAADVTGYYSSTGVDTYTPLAAPVRVLDTRIGVPTVDDLGPIGPGKFVDLTISGAAGMPINVDAVVLNVTAVGATAGTFEQVYPTPPGADTPPTVSNLNVLPGHTVANLVTVGVGAGGQIRLRNAYGNVQLVADVAGYFSADPNGALFTPVDATRLLDTRGNAPTPAKTPTGPGGVYDLTVTGNQGMPAGAVAALFNYTAISPTVGTYVQAYPTPPSGNPIPATSNINLLAGEIRANLAVVAIGSGGDIRLRNHTGTTNLLVDLAGYYTTAAGVDHGTAPTDAPGFAGLVVTAALVDAHPGQYGTVTVNAYTNADSNPFTAAAYFRSGVVQLHSSTTAGVPISMNFGVKTAPLGVLVPIVLTATDSVYYQTAASATVAFEPVPTTCKTAPNPPNPQQHTVLDLMVATVPGASVSVVYHFKAGAATQASKADKTGHADVLRNIGGATVGFAVPVTVTVTLGLTHGTCSTTFTPRA
jgi:hypothetical protein